MIESQQQEEKKKVVVCFGCKNPVEIGQCPTCLGYNLPARNGKSLFIKEEDFAEPVVEKTKSAKPNYTFTITELLPIDTIYWTNTDEESLEFIGNGNIDHGLILFKYWFQKNKNKFPRGNQPTVREIRDDLDDVSSDQRHASP